ncbi:isochorismate synthase family protein [Opitutaceae bacterium TAV1]|nr:isochorismate synthase family protein [Opitutaceae bacterium TAV1]
MTILPIHPAENATPEALGAFLAQCREMAARDGREKLVSISLAVDALDPLAVLESIFEPDEPHFYTERPGMESAIAGAEIAVAYTAHGPERFAQVQRFIDDTLAHTIAVGDVEAPFGGPHFFTTFTFHDEVEAGEPFAAAHVFVPRWQVARAGGVTTAVANLLVAPDADLAALTERVWRAHGKFANFEYRSGAGVPPAGPDLQEQEWRGRPARIGQEVTVPDAVNALRLASVEIRDRGYLPHWTCEGAIYAVNFRLADSLPKHVLAGWMTERDDIVRRAEAAGRPLSRTEQGRLDELYSERVEAFLDSGEGECWLARNEIAALVRDAILHFHGERYELLAWCIMPNHVHVILHPFNGYSLKSIVHSWKSWTAHQANRCLERTGEFWQEEYYDHLVRDEADYEHALEYLLANPERAGLRDWQWVGTCGAGGTPAPRLRAGRPRHIYGQDARAPFSIRDVGDYRAAVARGLERIAAGEFQKIVLARARDVVAAEPLHPLRVLNALRQRFPDCYAFSAANGRGQSFIGASPERLVRVSQGVLETEALAGSAPRGAGASEDAAAGGALLRSEKDRREQRLVLDSILRRLAPLGLRAEYPDTPGLRRLANVQHLHTPVRAVLPDGVRLLDALARLHPTPAVGGSPREAAVARIRELEGFPRGLYAGALGWINARGGGEFFVGLRSALVDGATARIYAGAGIVAGSEPEREYAETELKFRAVQDALAGSS